MQVKKGGVSNVGSYYFKLLSYFCAYIFTFYAYHIGKTVVLTILYYILFPPISWWSILYLTLLIIRYVVLKYFLTVIQVARLFKGRFVMIVIYIGDRDFNLAFALNLKLWKK